MKLLVLPVFLAFFAVSQVFCEETEPREEADYWTSSNQIQVPAPEPLIHTVINQKYQLLLSIELLKGRNSYLFLLFWKKVSQTCDLSADVSPKDC